LNQERRYAMYYCQALKNFESVSLGIDAQFDNHQLGLEWEPLTINDLIVPEKVESTSSLLGRSDCSSDYMVEMIKLKISELKKQKRNKKN
jgi:hypothetical protein